MTIERVALAIDSYLPNHGFTSSEVDDAARAVLAELLQPIETAPKDESMILLWFRDYEGPGEPRVIQGFWSIEYGDWFEFEQSNNPLTAWGNQPEYWMPIPEEPK